MADLSGFPYAELEFTKQGAVADPAQVAALDALLEARTPADLLVISHGWNNDMDEARSLYARFLASLRAVAGAGDRGIAVLGVLWPSKRFTAHELIAGGAASAAGDGHVRAALDRLAAALDDPAAAVALEEARALIPRLEDEATARARFADLVRSRLTREAADGEDASRELFDASGEQLMTRLRAPDVLAPPGGGGGAAGLGDLLADAKAAAARLANFGTYYEMKARAGLVGRSGLHPVLKAVQDKRPQLRLHLVGHSFGARLVTAAASAGGVRVDSVSLLQGAFSHYGFAQRWDGAADGLFRPMVTGGIVAGPTLITHTRNDTAVGEAYAIASRIAGQVAAEVGDAADRYGGLGSNGALKTPEADPGRLLPVGGDYGFQPGRLRNLIADEFVADHSDICGPEVAYAVLTAVAGI